MLKVTTPGFTAEYSLRRSSCYFLMRNAGISSIVTTVGPALDSDETPDCTGQCGNGALLVKCTNGCTCCKNGGRCENGNPACYTKPQRTLGSATSFGGMSSWLHR